MKRLMCAAAALVMMLGNSITSAADVTEHQWVRLSGNGAVMGRVIVPRSEGISAARGATVSLIDQSGNFASDPAKSDKTGRFKLNRVRPGVYTLLIQGEGLFACCAMHVVSPEVPINDTFEVAAGAVDVSVVQQAMVRYSPSSKSSAVEFDPSNNPMTSDRAILGESVRVLQTEGGLKGRLTRAGFAQELGVSEANVLIYRDGMEVARTMTDRQGNFTVPNLAPGSYSVLGAGRDGFGLMGMELVNPLLARGPRGGSASDETLVAQLPGVPETFVMQVAPYSGPITVVDDRLVDEEVVGPLPLGPDAAMNGGFAGGPMGGGGGGGGGGGLGGGGFGGLAVLGGIGAAIALGVSDDDDTVETPPAASPAAPIVTPE